MSNHLGVGTVVSTCFVCLVFLFSAAAAAVISSSALIHWWSLGHRFEVHAPPTLKQLLQVYVPLPHETAARIFAKERELKRVSDHGNEDEAPGGNPTKAAHGRDTAVEEFLTDPTLAPKFHRFAYRFLSRLVEETTQFKTDMARLVTGGQKCTTKAVLAARGQRRIKMLVLVDKKQSPVDKFAAALRLLLAQEPKMKKSGGPASLPIFVLKSTPDAQKKALQATIPAEELEALEQWEVKELQKLVATRDPTAEQDEQEDEDARRADITAEKARRVQLFDPVDVVDESPSSTTRPPTATPRGR